MLQACQRPGLGAAGDPFGKGGGIALVCSLVIEAGIAFGWLALMEVVWH